MAPHHPPLITTAPRHPSALPHFRVVSPPFQFKHRHGVPRIPRKKETLVLDEGQTWEEAKEYLGKEKRGRNLIYVMRHGLSEHNIKNSGQDKALFDSFGSQLDDMWNPSISKQGWDEAHEGANVLVEAIKAGAPEPAVMYVSPARRCLQTASVVLHVLAQHLPEGRLPKLYITDHLIEWRGWGHGFQAGGQGPDHRHHKKAIEQELTTFDKVKMPYPLANGAFDFAHDFEDDDPVISPTQPRPAVRQPLLAVINNHRAVLRDIFALPDPRPRAAMLVGHNKSIKQFQRAVGLAPLVLSGGGENHAPSYDGEFEYENAAVGAFVVDEVADERPEDRMRRLELERAADEHENAAHEAAIGEREAARRKRAREHTPEEAKAFLEGIGRDTKKHPELGRRLMTHYQELRK